ncbi:AraC family transcriptional regulator [Trinickia dabaoshanensis]|uniref:AraC family transcriptional regulator n=2 Tax=Trinickia dabaoshanensis TaxID=564714 RepID=A0A2N7VIE8_9BURK|nr:AraC family transcriptional regulator [Trinickia dabaoshanensis]
MPRVVSSHSHPRGQLMGAMTGLVSVGIASQQWVVPAIHAIWIPPHVEHSVRSFGPFAGWSVFISEDRCRELPSSARAIRTTPLLREAVHRAGGWAGSPLDAAQERIAEVIIDELLAAQAEPLHLPRPTDPALVKITDALTRDLGDNRRQEEWAAWAGVSPRTMSRRFIAQTGLTFGRWRQQARMLAALERVAEGAPVTRIALELGYENVSAFIEVFRSTFGATPGRYMAQQLPERTSADGAEGTLQVAE